MYAVVPRSHRARRSADAVDLADLRDDAWVQGPSATSPGLIRELCREAGFEPRIAFESDDPLATRGIVAAGLAVSLVPSLTQDDTARDRNVVVLPLRDPPRRRVVARDRGRRPPDAGDARDGRVARARRRPDRPEHRLASRAMAAERIDGKAIAQDVRAQVKRDVAAWVEQGHEPPGLATVLVGDDPASALYVGNKQKASAEVGIQGFDHRLPQDAAHEEVDAILKELAADPRVSGILLQLPTPPQVDGSGLAAMIPPGKDVDGLTPVSAGLLAQGRPGLRPCTPSGIMELLRRHDVAARGRRGGRGRPLRPRRPPDLRAAAGRQRHRHRLPLAHARPRRGLPPRRRARRRGRAPGADPGRLDQARRHGHRRRQPGRRRRLRGGRRARRADHAGPRRRRPDDDRDAAAQHAARGAGRRRGSRWGRGGADAPAPGRPDRRRRRRRRCSS